MGTQPIVYSGGMPFLVRVLWFVFVGWWATGAWILAAWLLNLTIVGLPFGLWMLNRVPMILTLQPARQEWLVGPNGVTQVLDAPQLPFIIRAIYFVLIGWWLSLLWCLVAYALSLVIVGLPLGLVMFNMVGLVTTLRRR